MSIAVFPFQIERFDDAQGVFGRQIPQLLVQELQEAGLAATRITWYARRADQVAHVALESPLPYNVLQEEMAQHDAQVGVLGHVRVNGETASLRIAILARNEQPESAQDVFDASAPRDMLPSLVQSAANALIRLLRGDDNFFSQSDRGDTPFEAWNALLLDADSQDLIREGGLASLVHSDHAWAHLAQALPWLPSSMRNAQTEALRTRIAMWMRSRETHLAMRAQRTLARGLRHDEREWTRLTWLAERLHAREVCEEAMRALASCSSNPSRASLALGVFLVSTGRHDEAYFILHALANDPDYRDCAQTYLGIILASRGELKEATVHWQRVVQSGTNADMIEKSRRHLSRQLAVFN